MRSQELGIMMTAYSTKPKRLLKLTTDYYGLKNKEKLAYQALSALLDFCKGRQRHVHPLLPEQNFNLYKTSVLNIAEQYRNHKALSRYQQDPQFNVTHYVSAILRASSVNYRNMVIIAALKDLNELALHKLITNLSKKCIEISKKIKASRLKLNHTQQ